MACSILVSAPFWFLILLGLCWCWAKGVWGQGLTNKWNPHPKKKPKLVHTELNLSILDDEVLLKHGGLSHGFPLAVHLFFCAEQVEGVILSHIYSLGFIIIGPVPFGFRSYCQAQGQ